MPISSVSQAIAEPRISVTTGRSITVTFKQVYADVSQILYAAKQISPEVAQSTVATSLVTLNVPPVTVQV